MSRSIRFTLNLWYVVILSVVLCLFSLLFYLNVASNLARDVDKTLALQADGVAETIFAFWRAEHGATGFGPGNWTTAPSQTFEGEIEQGGLPALLSRWAEKTGNLDTERPVRLLDNTGPTLGASPSFIQLALPEAKIVAPHALQGDTVYKTFLQQDHHTRLITRPISVGRRIRYYVQVAASLQHMDASLARLRVLLLLLIPSMLLATSSIGLLLATKALGPIGKVVTQAHQFIAESLHERMDVSSATDELEQLDTTFTEMMVRLERAFRRLRQFSAAASHELRTPLTVMKGEIEVALRRPRSTDEYRHVLQTHLQAIDEMAHTVEELLRLAQTEAVEGEAQWRPVELGASAEHVCRTLKPIAKAKSTRLEMSVTGPVWVRGDSHLLQRLLANLLDNALKHTPPKGFVNIQIEIQGTEASLLVRDTGPGIPPEQLPQLFDQFFKRRPTEDGASSTGLGLGLCRWIVELHHGRIDVASTPGQGTTFTVRLPLTAPSA